MKKPYKKSLKVEKCVICNISAYKRRKNKLAFGIFALPRAGSEQYHKWVEVIGKRRLAARRNYGVCGRHFYSGKPSQVIHHPDFVPKSEFVLQNVEECESFGDAIPSTSDDSCSTSFCPLPNGFLLADHDYTSTSFVSISSWSESGGKEEQIATETQQCSVQTCNIATTEAQPKAPNFVEQKQQKIAKSLNLVKDPIAKERKLTETPNSVDTCDTAGVGSQSKIPHFDHLKRKKIGNWRNFYNTATNIVTASKMAYFRKRRQISGRRRSDGKKKKGSETHNDVRKVNSVIGGKKVVIIVEKEAKESTKSILTKYRTETAESMNDLIKKEAKTTNKMNFEKPYHCGICGVICGYFYLSYYSHVTEEHFTQNALICTLCPFSTRWRLTAMNEHYDICHPNSNSKNFIDKREELFDEVVRKIKMSSSNSTSFDAQALKANVQPPLKMHVSDLEVRTENCQDCTVSTNPDMKEKMDLPSVHVSEESMEQSFVNDVTYDYSKIQNVIVKEEPMDFDIKEELIDVVNCSEFDRKEIGDQQIGDNANGAVIISPLVPEQTLTVKVYPPKNEGGTWLCDKRARNVRKSNLFDI